MKRRDDLFNLVKLACERFGKLDVLVNNAGIAPNSLLYELRVEAFAIEQPADVDVDEIVVRPTSQG